MLTINTGSDDDGHFNLWDMWSDRGTAVPTIDGSAPVCGDDTVGTVRSSDVPNSGLPDHVNTYSWPGWCTGFRDHQVDAVEKILDAFTRTNTVILDAPVGSGKTLIAEMVRVGLETRGLYVCSGKQLQDQFARDFEYAKILKGRSNYATESFPFPSYSTADCTKRPSDDESCLYCSRVSNCAYEKAKRDALGSDVAVLNTTYLLYEANYAGRFSGADFVVVDECDLVESELMRFVEFQIPARRLEELGIEAPIKGAHKPTIKAWIDGALREGVAGACRKLEGKPLDDAHAAKELKYWQGILNRIDSGLSTQIEGDNWVRDYSSDDEKTVSTFILKPVTVEEYGDQFLWSHAKRWLLMSGTVCSPTLLASELGITDFENVTVPMTFPVESRPIVMANVADMTFKKEKDEQGKLLEAVDAVVRMHEGENILVHTNSYRLTKYLFFEMRKRNYGCEIMAYSESRYRDRTIQKFRQMGGVLLAPSADRGVDLPDDLCRVQVIAKVPFPSLADKQTSARLHVPMGQQWYSVQTIRTIVQMTGRGVRHKGDYCITYILDKQFGRVYKEKALLPKYFIESVNFGTNTEQAKRLRKTMKGIV